MPASRPPTPPPPPEGPLALSGVATPGSATPPPPPPPSGGEAAAVGGSAPPRAPLEGGTADECPAVPLHFDWDCDSLVPPVGDFRAQVLGFLPETCKSKLALINEDWFDAAAQWEAWAPEVARWPAPIAPLMAPSNDASKFADSVHGDANAVVSMHPAGGGPAHAAATAPALSIYAGHEVPAAAASLLKVTRRPRTTAATDEDDDDTHINRAFLRGDVGAPLRFVSPVMYGLVFDVLRSSSARSLLAAADSTHGWPMQRLLALASGIHLPAPGHESTEVLYLLGQLFSNVATRIRRFPLAHVLLRCPYFMTLPPSSANSLAGYCAMPPWQVLLCLVSRLHTVNPVATNVPWLVSFGQWAAEHRDPRTGRPMPFHKALAAPLLAAAAGAAKSNAARLTRVKYYWAIVEVSISLIDRYMYREPGAFEARQRLREALAATRGGGTAERPAPLLTQREWRGLLDDERRYAPSWLGSFSVHPQYLAATKRSDERLGDGELERDEHDTGDLHRPPRYSVQVLSDTDPRILFSVLQYLRQHYSKLRMQLDDRVLQALGRWGLQELACSEKRVELLQRAREVHDEEPPTAMPQPKLKAR